MQHSDPAAISLAVWDSARYQSRTPAGILRTISGRYRNFAVGLGARVEDFRQGRQQLLRLSLIHI